MEDKTAADDSCGSSRSELTESETETETETEPDSRSVMIESLYRNLRKLSGGDRESEERLRSEGLECLVARVEEEVEFEGMVDGMLADLKADEEFMAMERQEKEWETERREQLEEEIELLRSKVEMLEEVVRLEHTEKGYYLSQKQCNVGEIPCDNLMEELKRKGKALEYDLNDEEMGKGGGLLLGRFRSEAMLEVGVGQLEQIRENSQAASKNWSSKERQLQGQILALEKGIGKTADILKEKESLLGLERERRLQYKAEVDQTLALWRNESTVHEEARRNLKMFQDCFFKLKEKSLLLSSMPVVDLQTLQVQLSEFLRDINEVSCDRMEVGGPSEVQQSLEKECIETWKSQRDRLEDERDKLEEKLDLYMAMAEEDGKKMEEFWQEKGREIDEQEAFWNRRVQSILQEKKQLEIRSDAIEKERNEERERFIVFIRDRENWMEERTKEWLHLLSLKEEELFSLKSMQKKIGNSLSMNNIKLLELEKSLPLQDCLSEEEREVSDLEESFLVVNRQKERKIGSDNGFDLASLVDEMEMLIGRFQRSLKEDQERRHKETTEVQIRTEELKQERKALEEKVSETLNLMEILKQEIKAKEGRFEYERKQMEQVLSLKCAEIEDLRNQMKAKEHDTETDIQRSDTEVLFLQKEVDTGVKSHEITDLHQENVMREKKEIEDELEMTQWDMYTLRHGIDGNNTEIQMDFLPHQENMMREKKEIEEEPKMVQRDMYTPRQGTNGNNTEIQMDFGHEIIELHQKNIMRGKKEIEGDSGLHPRDIEWDAAMRKIGSFDRQISEAMSAIESLKEDLDIKERVLQQERVDRGTNKVKNIQQVHEYERLKKQLEQFRRMETHKALEWDKKERMLQREKEELCRLLEVEREDGANAMSILQEAMRELQWALAQYKGKEEDIFSKIEPHVNLVSSETPAKTELVNGHTSHLKHIDRFIHDFELKLGESDNKAKKTVKNSGIAEGGKQCPETPTKEKTWLHFSPENQSVRSSWSCVDNGNPFDSEFLGRESDDRYAKKMENLTAQGRPLSEDKQIPFRVSHNSQGSRRNSNLTSFDMGSRLDMNRSNWMMTRDALDERFISDDLLLQRDSFTLKDSTPPPPPSRSHRKWLVDASWLEQVRKEQSILRHQLELEQRRVTILGQVEAENRWMEEAMVQVLEQKKESDANVLDLRKKVAFLEAMGLKMNNMDNCSY